MSLGVECYAESHGQHSPWTSLAAFGLTPISTSQFRAPALSSTLPKFWSRQDSHEWLCSFCTAYDLTDS